MVEKGWTFSVARRVWQVLRLRLAKARAFAQEDTFYKEWMKTTATASADAPTLAEEEFFGAEVADSVAEFDGRKVHAV